MALTMFTMNADAANLVASGSIEGISGLQAHFELNANADEWLRVTGGARPLMLTFKRITGYFRSDGRMYDQPATSPAPYDIDDPGTLGVRLPANDPNLNLLNDVSYYVSWEAEIDGQAASFYPFNTPAVPSIDTTVDLASFAPGPGHPLVGIPQLGLVDDLADMTTVGKESARAESKAAGRAAIDALGAADITAAAIIDATDLTRAFMVSVDDVTARNVISAGMAQRSRYGADMLFDGDSITIRPGAGQSRGGWAMELCRLSDGRINYVANIAVASTGITTRLANIAAALVTYNPQTVLLSNGTNDMPIMTLSQYLTYLTQYYDIIRAAGVQLILGGIYPKNVDADKVSTWNAGIVDWARARGVLVIPFWELAKRTNGAWPDGWSTDGVHLEYDSPAFPAIGKLAWQTISRALTDPVAATARYATDPAALMTNFFEDLTATMSGVATITGLASTTGTLAAGDYTYRVVACLHHGNSPTYADSTITLGAPGGVIVTSGASGTYTSRRVYRKGPADTTFYYVGQITGVGSQTFTDGGVAAGYAWRGGDTSKYPKGMIVSGWQDIQTLAYGDPIRDGAPEGIRGNIFRGARCEGSAFYRSDRFLFTGLTPGQTINVSIKCKGVNLAGQDGLHLRFFNPAGNTQVEDVVVFSTRFGPDWGTINGRAVVPSGSDRVYVCLEGSANTPWNDWAELRVF